jgi:hypothetical protein
MIATMEKLADDRHALEKYVVETFYPGSLRLPPDRNLYEVCMEFLKTKIANEKR